MPQSKAKSKPAAKSGWLRLYTDMLDDSKAQRLPPHLFKTWINLLCLSKIHDGTIPTIDEVAFRLRLSVHDAQAAIDELIMQGLIDIMPDQALKPHNWTVRQYRWDGKDPTAAERKRRSRHSQCHGRVTVDVTDDVTENRSVSVYPGGELSVEGNLEGNGGAVTTDEVPL